ncbi:hypothetical protein K435DRAFT_802551 [Dendrothele bispora CBS 962.96]|uniref:Uncharacterized protein n=1 Tax=Dendrothele bispora (strain CBS 962.96) TaxID=1314807 RepID=A0A4S8LKN0_DENBC|nr:hypothetical protein K435DRAFT_802551 [Dendrothele bispora CBS 962.96]
MSEDASPTPDAVFVPYGERRVRDGIYDAIIDMELAMGPNGLGQIDPHTDLTFGPTFLANKAFLGPDDKPFAVQLLGEFAPGTNVEPTGNHNAPKGKLEPINDKSRVKWNWSLKCPDSAPEPIRHLFHNQITTLNNAIDPEHASPTLKTWNTSHVSDDYPDLIYLGTEKIYCVPKGSPTAATPTFTKMVKKPLFTKSTADASNPSSGASTSTLASDEGSSVSPPNTRKPGDLLSPSVLPGYGGGWFNHTSAARLVQLDICDPDGNLIHPHDWWKWIVEGNLVFATAEMHFYDINGWKTYSLVMKSIQILDKSDAVPVMPRQRVWETQKIPSPEPVAPSPPPLPESPSKYSPGQVNLGRRDKGKKRAVPADAESSPKQKVPKRNGPSTKK